MEKVDSSWEEVGQWYDQHVGDEGHFYHREVIIPRLKDHLQFDRLCFLLDLGCGQGIIERHLPSQCNYMGVDASDSLLSRARRRSKVASRSFVLADLSCSQSFSIKADVVLFLLSLQNIHNPAQALRTAAAHLAPGGRIALVLNHPCFRIPRHSEWFYEPRRGALLRCVDSYCSPQEIPITARPSLERSHQSEKSISYHFSLQQLWSYLEPLNLKIDHLEEWYSPKTSQGGRAKAENRARSEFPLFLYVTLVS